MKGLFLFLFLTLISIVSHSQCVGIQSFTLNPPPVANQYSAGQIITACYTMQGWPGLTVNSNWLEGFDINLGPGWSNITQQAPPQSCGGSGQWSWMNSTTSSFTGITVGPGWFFQSTQGGPVFPPGPDGNPGNDWGDNGDCTWSFCFQVTVAQVCVAQNLLIQVTAGADGTWGSWSSNTCPTTPFNIFNGTISTNPITLGLISHN